MTKQEKIIEAYGKYWDKVEEYVNENGWCNAFWNTKTYFRTDSTSTKWRPKSLAGIESNNGWNLMSDADFEDDEHILFLRYIDGEGEPPILTSVLSDDFEIRYFTHWKRIDFSKPPIY